MCVCVGGSFDAAGIFLTVLHLNFLEVENYICLADKQELGDLHL